MEVIIVDDGSTDNTIGLVKDRFKNIRSAFKLIIISTGGRRGANFARNLGAKKSAGDIIFFHDSDDLWLPDKVATFVEIFRRLNPDAVFSSLIKVNSGSVTLYPAFMGKESKFINLKTSKAPLIKNPVSTQCLAVTRKTFFDLRGFDSDLPRFQDWEFALRLFKKHKVYYLKHALSLAYISTDSITRNFKAGIIARKKLFDKHRDMYDTPYLCMRFIFDIKIRELYYKLANFKRN